MATDLCNDSCFPTLPFSAFDPSLWGCVDINDDDWAVDDKENLDPQPIIIRCIPGRGQFPGFDAGGRCLGCSYSTQEPRLQVAHSQRSHVLLYQCIGCYVSALSRAMVYSRCSCT